MVAGNLFLVMVTIMNNMIIREKWCPARFFVGDCMPGATLFLRCAEGWKGDDDDMNEDGDADNFATLSMRHLTSVTSTTSLGSSWSQMAS